MRLSSYSPIVNSLPRWLIISGSYKRHKDEPNKIIGDLDILSLKSIDNVLKYFSNKYNLSIKRKGTNYLKLVLNNKYNVDIWETTKENLPFAQLQYDTGKGVIQYKSKARKHGYLLNQYGLFKNDKRINIKTKENIINFLNKL